MAPRLRLHHRLAIPFAVIAIVGISATAWVSLGVVTSTLETRVETQLVNALTRIRNSDFALNPPVLQILKDITGADVVTFSEDGQVLVTTMAAGATTQLLSETVRQGVAQRAAAADAAVVIWDRKSDVPIFRAYRRLAARPDTIVAIVAQTSELLAARRATTRAILAAAVFGVVAMILLSQVIARRVTSPLEALVTFTREVSPAGSSRRAPSRDDEVGRLAAAFNEMLDRLSESQNALVRSEKLGLTGLLAARVAHDIRNPLSSMKMQTQLLRSRLQSDPQEQELIGALLHDIETVESVVRDLLELARPGELRLKRVPLNTVVRDVLRQMAPQLTYRKIAVEAEFAEPMADALLDPDRFKQALLNVIVNAADAMPSGGTLQVITKEAGSGHLTIEVADDGIGLDPSIADRVFDPFVSTKRDGVGLGLVNTKAVVESHGGRIELAPRTPRGTRAVFTLPSCEHTSQTESAGGAANG